jgi:hypothetical protein
VVEGRLGGARVGAAEVELDELVADDLGADVGFGVTGEFIVETSEPTAVDGFGFGTGLKFAVIEYGHWGSLFQEAYSMAKTA